MMRSLFSGVSGLKTHQTKMDVIGNNISNVNTVAFKSSSTTFSDIMYQTTSQASGATDTRGGVNAKQIGLGVTNGATKISITSSGAAQSTGDALDIRLTDTKTTNFFVVSNGSENVFTRAGSFYVDGNGNLAMTTTGYLVMGWQVDPETMDIRKDTVTPLRVMQPANMTSDPEATTQATFSGIVDQNDTNVKTSEGYIRSLTVYDSLGYSYTAKFSIKAVDTVRGKYSVELVGILDSKNKDVYKAYLENAERTPAEIAANLEGAALLESRKQALFGKPSTEIKNFSLNKSVAKVQECEPDGGSFTTIVYKKNNVNYILPADALTADANKLVTVENGIPTVTFVESTDIAKGSRNTSNTIHVPITELCNISEADAKNLKNGAFNLEDGVITLGAQYDTVNYGLQFDTKLGTLTSVTQREEAGDSPIGMQVVLNSSLLGPNRDAVPETSALDDITIDFSQLLNVDNSGISTVIPARGALDGTTGAGKKLGTMTGLSVSNDGRIFGSYSNGNTILLGQIAAAQFANASGLEEIGNNCYKTTLNSGEFDGIGIDISADGSSMSTGQLEMSNVDLSAEFTDMIVTQRGFQANSRIITVSDTLLEELINLKR